MSDVFLRYKREDEERAALLVLGLEQAGLSVWWDREIPAGQHWRQALDEQLDAARCVVVLWSEASVQASGDFIHDEAGRGKSRGILLPIRIDDVQEPLGFGEVQSLDLVGWSGDLDDPRFADVVAAAKAFVGGAPSTPKVRVRGAGPPTWIARTVGIFPSYIADLLRLTLSPKRFLADRVATTDFQWEGALIFAAISYVLADLLTLTIPHQTLLVTDFAFGFTNMLAYGAAIYLAWRLVGATAPVQKFFTIHFYIAGVLRWGMAVSTLTLLGTLRVLDRDGYARVTGLLHEGDILGGLIQRAPDLPTGRDGSPPFS